MDRKLIILHEGEMANNLFIAIAQQLRTKTQAFLAEVATLHGQGDWATQEILDQFTAEVQAALDDVVAGVE